MSIKEERMGDADDEVCNRYGKTYSARRIKREPMSPQREDQYSCSLIKVEKEEDDTDAVDTHDRYEYFLELEVKKEEPCETRKEEQDTVFNAEHDGRESSSVQHKPDSVHNTDMTVKDEIEIGPTVIQPQYIGSSLHTTDASKAELIQCGGADVTLDTTTPGAASYRAHSTAIHEGTTDQIKKTINEISCNICPYKCSFKSSLVMHMRVHTGEKPFFCNTCEYKCKDKSALAKHTRVHTGEKPYSCNICLYKCKQKSSLGVHMRVHTREKQFSCHICLYKCSFKSSLVTHMRVHTGEKPFFCNSCEYKCKDSSALTKHMRIHTGEKPFSCKMCKYNSNVKSHLVRHMRVHTGEKPFPCNICKYKCKQKSSLVAHMLTHTKDKPFCCNICQYKCKDKTALVRHMRIHTKS